MYRRTRTHRRRYTARVTRPQLITALTLVTIICAGLALLLLPERDATPQGAVPLVPFAPSEVRRVDVEQADGGVQRLTRTEPDRWEIEFGPEGAQVRWPAATDRVRGFLRILDRLRAMPASEAPAVPPQVIARITDDSGQTITLGLPASTLGGRAVVELTRPGFAPSHFVTSDELSRLLAGGGLANWLDPRPFAPIDGQVEEIVVESAGGAMRLARSGSGWRIEEPFASAAEPALVEELLAGLQTLPFRAPRAGAPEGGESGGTLVRLRTQARRPTADGGLQTVSREHTLRTAAAPDAGGSVRCTIEAVSPDGPVAGPLAADVDAARLSELVRQPPFYLSRRTLAVPEGDLAGVAVTYPDGPTFRWERPPGEGWTKASAEAPDAAGSSLDSLARLLTQVNAPVVVWVGEADPPEATLVAMLEPLALGGAALAEAELWVGRPPGAPADARAHAVLVREGVARYYPPEGDVSAVAWIASQDPKRR